MNPNAIPNMAAIATSGRAIAAKLAHPERQVVTITGDAGFMMNSQEIETLPRVYRRGAAVVARSVLADGLDH